MNKYGLHNKLKASAGNGTALMNILLEAAAVVSTTSGCYLYLVSQDASDQDTIWITEVWEDKKSHDNSLKLDAVRSLIGQAMPLIGEAPQQGSELLVRGGHGIKLNQ